MVHFIENQKSQLFDLGFEEEALQKALPPSAAHPFLFLAGMGSAGYSCPATVLVEDCGSFGCWGWTEGFTGIREPGSQHIWCASEGGKQCLPHR